VSDERTRITLYGTRISRPFRVYWMLQECGLDFDHVDVRPDGSECSTTSAWYLDLNPNARVPTLVDADLVLSQTPAINTYLARKYGKGDIETSSPDALGRALQWAFFANADIEPAVVTCRREIYKQTTPQRDPLKTVGAEAALHRALAVVEGALGQHVNLQGSTWGLADFMVASVLYALEEYRYAGFGRHPRLREWLDTSYSRPAAKRAITWYRNG